VEIAEDQESRLLYYITREVRYSILEPFILDENIKDIKVISPGLNALVIHKDYDFLGWLKTNAVFTDARHTKELMARFVGKSPRNPPAEC
jgi:type IV secretory pathway ATPase VirB11/archaellum biosynthesis ATPase